MNATEADRLVLDAPQPLGTYRFRILDVIGQERDAGTVRLDGPRAFRVPPGGRVVLARVP